MTNDIIRNHYLLVASDTNKSRLSMPSAYEVALHRLKIGEWGVNRTTRNRKTFKKGDFVLIYISGKRTLGMHFIASAEIGSTAMPISRKRCIEIDAPKNAGIIFSDFAIKISNFNIFKNPVSIKTIKEQLEFIKHPQSKKWGFVMANGSLKLSENDYNKVTNLGSQRN